MTAAAVPSYLSKDTLGPWATFLEQVDRVIPYLGPLAAEAEALKHPRRSLIVDVPVRMDDGSVQRFEGYRVHHSTAIGPGKGGVRFHPDVTLPEVMALAGWMTIKSAALGLPFGGAKGGVRVNPKALSGPELERLTRRYTSEIGILIGPDKDIPAPDLGTNEQVMAWMMDTYSMNQGRTVTGVVTGKPIAIGGSLGRREATGRGLFVAAREACRQLGLDVSQLTVSVQGFGNVGSVAARMFHGAGARIVALQDNTGTLHDPAGIDPHRVLEHMAGGGKLVDYDAATRIADHDFWAVPCDVLVPAALEEQITASNAAEITARLVVEGANGPTTPAADDVLADRGIRVVPDVVANAGGVTVSYFEWVQDFSSFFWTEDEINQRLENIMVAAFARVWALAEAMGLPMRTAAYVLACRRVLEARTLLGLYP